MDYNNYDQRNPTISKSAPHISSEGGKDGNDGTERPSTQQSYLTKSKAYKRKHAQARPTVIDSAPSRNTRSQTRTMTTEASGTRPTTRSRKRMSQLIRTMPAKRNKTTQTDTAAALEGRRKNKRLRQTTQKINNLEIEVHQAMEVMDEQTRRLFDDKQLMRDPKYKKNWSTSSANEFGRLANGVCSKN